MMIAVPCHRSLTNRPYSDHISWRTVQK